MWQTSPFPESAEPESWVPSPKYLARGGVGLWLVTQPVESVECTQYTPWLKNYSQDIFDIFDLERVVLCCIKLSFCATINSGTRNLLQKYICTVYIIGHWHCTAGCTVLSTTSLESFSLTLGRVQWLGRMGRGRQPGQYGSANTRLTPESPNNQ